MLTECISILSRSSGADDTGIELFALADLCVEYAVSDTIYGEFPTLFLQRHAFLTKCPMLRMLFIPKRIYKNPLYLMAVFQLFMCNFCLDFPGAVNGCRFCSLREQFLKLCLLLRTVLFRPVREEVCCRLKALVAVEKYRVPPGLSIPRHFATSEIQSLFMSRVVSVLWNCWNVGGSRIIMS